MDSDNALETYVNNMIDEEMIRTQFTRNIINNINGERGSLTQSVFDRTPVPSGFTPVTYYGITDPVEIDDVREVLGIHIRKKLGCEDRRQKASDNKVKSVDRRICHEARQELHKSRLNINDKITSKIKANLRKYSTPVAVWIPDFVEEEVYETFDQVTSSILEMHKKGRAAQDHPDYYLHMIFRHYMNKFHKEAESRGMVTSRQYISILDHLYPVGCSKPPIEFVEFIDMIECTDTDIPNTPIPAKGCSKECIVSEVNFEGLFGISQQRDSIFRSFRRWKERLNNGDNMVYPKYLQAGFHAENLVKEMYVHMGQSDIIQSSFSRMSDKDKESLRECTVNFGNISAIHIESQTMLCLKRKPTPLQRVNYFLFSKNNREVFQTVVRFEEGKLVDSICDSYGWSPEEVSVFKDACNAGSKWKDIHTSDESRRIVMKLLDLFSDLSASIIEYKPISEGGMLMSSADLEKEIVRIESFVDEMEVEE